MPQRDRRSYDVAKRVLDVYLGVVGLVLSLPLQLFLALVVRLVHGSPVLFRQERPGKDGEIFELMKFRSMRHPDAAHVTDAERLTSLGKFLRATSLDELPTLVNVVKGDMSLVGPRPLLVQYLGRYTPEQARRHEVRPGVTGLAQVRGRNGLTWDEKLALDVGYVDNRSLTLDLRVLWETVGAVLYRKGISAEGHATMAEFRAHTSEGAS